MRRLSTVLMAALLALAACGGDSGSGDTQDETTVESSTAQTSGTDDTESAPATSATVGSVDATDGPTPDASVGTLTVAGETYTFADTGFPGLQCMPASFNVAFLSFLMLVDENGEALQGGLTVAVPFKGSEETAGILPAVSGTVGDLEWIADPEHADLNGIPQGSSQVDSYEIDGNTITGTATFYEETSSFGQGDLVVEKGTFEVTCADG